MKYNQNRRLMRGCYAVTACLILLTGFTSLAAEQHTAETEAVQVQEQGKTETAADEAAWDFAEITAGIHEDTVADIKAAAEKAHEDYMEKAEEEAAREAAAQAAAETAAREKELLAALIFCEAGNQPYEGQVAVGAVVMNRVNSGQFPDTITDVIYQSGQATAIRIPRCRLRPMRWPAAIRSGTVSTSAPAGTAISWGIISSGKRRIVCYKYFCYEPAAWRFDETVARQAYFRWICSHMQELKMPATYGRIVKNQKRCVEVQRYGSI